MSKEYITMDNRRTYTYIYELDKVNRNNTILNKDALNFSNKYHDTDLLMDTTSSLRSDLDELKDYLKEQEANKKKRRISVRIRL